MQIHVCKTKKGYWHLNPRTTHQGQCGAFFLGLLLDQDWGLESEGKMEIKDLKKNTAATRNAS